MASEIREINERGNSESIRKKQAAETRCCEKRFATKRFQRLIQCEEQRS